MLRFLRVTDVPPTNLYDAEEPNESLVDVFLRYRKLVSPLAKNFNHLALVLYTTPSHAPMRTGIPNGNVPELFVEIYRDHSRRINFGCGKHLHVGVSASGAAYVASSDPIGYFLPPVCVSTREQVLSDWLHEGVVTPLVTSRAISHFGARVLPGRWTLNPSIDDRSSARDLMQRFERYELFDDAALIRPDAGDRLATLNPPNFDPTGESINSK